jgi:hypothetical protein
VLAHLVAQVLATQDQVEAVAVVLLLVQEPLELAQVDLAVESD